MPPINIGRMPEQDDPGPRLGLPIGLGDNHDVEK